MSITSPDEEARTTPPQPTQPQGQLAYPTYQAYPQYHQVVPAGYISALGAPMMGPQVAYASQAQQPMYHGIPYGQAAAPWPTVYLPLVVTGPSLAARAEAPVQEKKSPVVLLEDPIWVKGVDGSNERVCWVHSISKKKSYTDPYE